MQLCEATTLQDTNPMTGANPVLYLEARPGIGDQVKQTISHFHVNNSNSKSREKATSYLSKYLVPGAPALD